MLAEVLTNPPLNLALIQWYDFKSKKNPYLYGCPYLKLVELYNFVAIESIQGVVHIIPRFDKKNEYFVNKFFNILYNKYVTIKEYRFLKTIIINKVLKKTKKKILFIYLIYQPNEKTSNNKFIYKIVQKKKIFVFL